MNPRFILVSLIILSLFLETTLVAFPLVFVLSILLYVLYPDRTTLLISFSAGLIIDILKVSPVGLTSVVILASFLLLDLVKKAFEIKDYKVILLILLISSFIFSKFFGYTDNLLVYLLIFGGAFIFLSYFYKRIVW